MKYFVKIKNGLVVGIYTTKSDVILNREKNKINGLIELDESKLNQEVIKKIQIGKTRTIEIENLIKNPLYLKTKPVDIDLIKGQ